MFAGISMRPEARARATRPCSSSVRTDLDVVCGTGLACDMGSPAVLSAVALAEVEALAASGLPAVLSAVALAEVEALAEAGGRALIQIASAAAAAAAPMPMATFIPTTAVCHAAVLSSPAKHHALRRHDHDHEDQAGLVQAGPAQSSGVNTGLN